MSNMRLVMPPALAGSAFSLALDADDDSGEEPLPPRGPAAPQRARDGGSEERQASPCSLTGGASSERRADGTCPVCALLHAAAYGGVDEMHAAHGGEDETHAAHGGVVEMHAAHLRAPAQLPRPAASPASALESALESALASASQHPPRTPVVWLNPHTRRHWNVLHENVPGE